MGAAPGGGILGAWYMGCMGMPPWCAAAPYAGWAVKQERKILSSNGYKLQYLAKYMLSVKLLMM